MNYRISQKYLWGDYNFKVLALQHQQTDFLFLENLN